ncbi:T9SS type A sorting domain-containing protein [bacterium]|nr:T9SS type A sorting domain-containing protein [bacterium]
MKTLLHRTIYLVLLIISTFVLHAQTLEISADQDTICPGDSVLLEATAGFETYDWVQGSDSRFVYADDAGVYIVFATDSNQNVYSDTIEIYEFPDQDLRYEIEGDRDTVCRGDSVHIQITEGFTEYWWSSGDDDRQHHYLANETKNFVVEAEDSNGCPYRIAFSIHTKDCDTNLCDSILQGPREVHACEGDSVALEGVYGFLSYEWSNGVDNRIQWVKQGGWYVLQVEVDENVYCFDSVLVVIQEGSDLEIENYKSPVYLCEGDSIVIEISDGFEEYWWNTGDEGSRNVLYPEDDFELVIEAVNAYGCESRVSLEIYMVECDNPCDVIHTDYISACEGDSAVIEVENGFDDYDWTDGEDGRIRWVHETGWYYVRAENNDGSFCIDSVEVEIFQDYSLTIYTNIPPNQLCYGDSIVVELSGGFAEYWWNTGHEGDRNVLYPEESFTLVVEAIDSNGCEARAQLDIEMDSCNVGLFDLSMDGIQLYPNPVVSTLQVEVSNVYINKTYRLFSANGKLITTGTCAKSFELDLSDYPSGIYYLNLGPHHFKIVKSN